MQRNLFIKLKAHLKKKEFTILTGARQSGKSTLLKQLQAASSAESIPCVFLNLENKTILAALDADPLNVFTYLPSTTKRAIVFIDEVQYLQDPSNFLKLLYDDHVEKIKIVATGSSAFYLDDAFRDSLAGRKKVFQLLTCSFDEYLKLSDKQDLLDEVDRIISNKKAKSTKIAYLKNEWETYMLYGGYPAIITETVIEEKINRLKEIRDSYIKRDILEAGVQNETAFYNLFRIIAGQSGGLINVNELSATLRIKNETINNYLLILQKCFHIALVKPFYKNLRKEITKMPKAFMLDTGLRNCLVNNFQPTDIRLDKGELWENMCYRVLADKHGMDAIHFWRTADGSEVDFVLPEIEVPYAVEAKYDNALVKPAKYKKFTETYPEIPLQFAWIKPFDETFFRHM
ncbi:MAG: ATP-binding protein [Ferruginibacter sp.]|nr:ATP-binding protein [Ferruginibacter sp.]